MTYSKAQEDYMDAKLKMERINKRVKESITHLGIDRRTQRTEYHTALSNLREQFGYLQANNALIAAEQELMSWAHDQIKGTQEYKEKASEFTYLYANYDVIPSIRDQMIDAALSLQA